MFNKVGLEAFHLYENDAADMCFWASYEYVYSLVLVCWKKTSRKATIDKDGLFPIILGSIIIQYWMTDIFYLHFWEKVVSVKYIR